ncbi:Pleiotropic drug resistance protein 2 [Ranunculus cassubicifolius]
MAAALGGEGLALEQHDNDFVANPDMQDKKQLLDGVLGTVEQDNEKLLQRLRDRTDKVGIEIPTIEVRFNNLSIEADAYVGRRAIPTLYNSALNSIEKLLGFIGLSPSKKTIKKILQDVSGIVRPSRLTLLLGPPGSGKTTLLQSLSGLPDKDLRVTGSITYCGHELHEFVPKKTCAYIGQHDLHYGEMTVRETMDFAGRCLGVGARYDMMAQLSKREKEAGITPDPHIAAFMKAIALEGQKTSLNTYYILKILGLDTCSDIMVGDEMWRGISGGQKKRLTTGEMLVGPSRAFYMDEISTGLDSSTTFQITEFMRQMAHIMDVTMIISLLQPAPETFNLFDDIVLLSEGQIVYQGPRENVLEFFEFMGFQCPKRKGVADFLQEVTSKKDQEQYWFNKSQPYKYVSVNDFVQSFKTFHIGQQLSKDLSVPYEKSRAHPDALVTQKYGISNWELFKACFAREFLMVKRSSPLYIFKSVQISLMSIIVMTIFWRTTMKHGKIQDGGKFFGALFFGLVNVMFNSVAELAMTTIKLPVFYKQRDLLFFPAWAFALPIWVLRIPLSVMESGLWIIFTYYTIGFAPSAKRFFRQFLALLSVHQMALGLFRFVAAVGRTMVVATTLGTLTILMCLVLGGYIVSKDDLAPWMVWGYYISPMMYGQNAIALNEFLDERWSSPVEDPSTGELTVGKAILRSRGLFVDEYMFWVCIAALNGFSLLFNLCFVAALNYLDPLGDSRPVGMEDTSDNSKETVSSTQDGKSVESEITLAELLKQEVGKASEITIDHSIRKGMVLPFQPLSLAFKHVNYYVDMPSEMRTQGVAGSHLQLLSNVSGSFRPGILTALVGVSGAGKTTLMDVLAGRKTGGYIEGSIHISGYPKRQATFARVSGYCEQNDIHSPRVTVYESLVYSAWLRLSSEIKPKTRQMFVDEIMGLVELNPSRDALVGLPGVDGLSTEQRKRLTIAVELVANPSIIFMDEPTSGLDARSAAIVMRTVRNTVDTGRTVVCTIHQPSIDIFESFDELLLMKLGGQIIYAGPLGRSSHKLVKYFEAIQGIPKIKEDHNPATWMLEVSSSPVEVQIGVDLAEVYANSTLYQKNQEIIDELSTPKPGSTDLYFPDKFSQSFSTQCMACFWKQHWSYWRNPPYNTIRFLTTAFTGCLLGVIFWNQGQKMTKQQDILNIMGAMYTAVFLLGGANASSVQPVVAVERTVFYRERAAGMYSPLAYAFSQVAIETCYLIIQCAIYTLLMYFMIGFEQKLDKFFWFFFFIFMSFVYFTLFGMMAVSLTPNQQIGSVLIYFFLGFWNLFTGFVIPRPQIPIWWRWYYWGSPVSWTLYGLITSQLGDKNDRLDIPGTTIRPTVKVFLKFGFGYEHDFLGYVALAHITIVLIFFFVFGYGIKILNFQKR